MQMPKVSHWGDRVALGCALAVLGALACAILRIGWLSISGQTIDPSINYVTQPGPSTDLTK